METDRDGFAAIVRQHQAMVWSIAYHSLRDEAQAEDIAQDVFLHLFSSLHRLEGPEHVTNWLRRVTTHRCIDAARQRKTRDQVPLERAGDPVASTPPGSDPFLVDRLRTLTAALPEKARAIVILRFQEDMNPSEIAAALRIPVNTVKSYLHRSLGSLREKLERTKVRAV